MKPIPKVSTTLPKEARDALIAAAKTRGVQDRKAAIQHVIERIQRKYPQFFKGATP